MDKVDVDIDFAGEGPDEVTAWTMAQRIVRDRTESITFRRVLRPVEA